MHVISRIWGVHCDRPRTGERASNTLSHMKGDMTMQQFHDACCAQRGPVPAVKIMQTGEVTEFLLQPDEKGKLSVGKYLHEPYPKTEEEPMVFHSTRKTRASSNKELTVYYYNSKALQANQVATNIFKMQLYGDVVLTQTSKEPSFMPRERYVPYTKATFDEQFMKKRKRSNDAPALCAEEYGIMHKEMQNEL